MLDSHPQRLSMCYSAQVYAGWKKFVRMFGATMSLEEFNRVFYERIHEPEARIVIPKTMEAAFAQPENDGERQVKSLIDEFIDGRARKLEEELFVERTRLVTAQRQIAEREAAGRKVTKHLLNEVRVATNKMSQRQGWIADVRRTSVSPADARIFPGSYCPVMVIENGELVVMPMRYQCRPEGRPAFYDVKFPATYNARRDNLEGHMWENVFGYRHGIIIASAFFEHVPRHKAEGRDLRPGEAEEDIILEFKPNGLDEMLVACIWSRWRAPGQADLLSFAVVTDEPPPEVAAAGHDRCIVPLRRENVDAWLRPDRHDLAAQYAILDDRERPYYEHRLAA